MERVSEIACVFCKHGLCLQNGRYSAYNCLCNVYGSGMHGHWEFWPLICPHLELSLSPYVQYSAPGAARCVDKSRAKNSQCPCWSIEKRLLARSTKVLIVHGPHGYVMLYTFYPAYVCHSSRVNLCTFDFEKFVRDWNIVACHRGACGLPTLDI